MFPRILGSLLLVFAATATRGAEAVPGDASEPELRVGAPADAYPYSFRNKAGDWDGFSVEVLDAIARVMQLRLRRVDVTVREMGPALGTGEVAILQHLQQTPEREAFADFTVPLLRLQGAIFVRRGGGVERREDLAGRRFAVFSLNSIGQSYLQNAGVAATWVPAPSPADGLRMVQEGLADGTYISQLTALSIIRRDGLDGVVRLGAPIEGFDVRHCLAVKKGEARILARLNEGLAVLHATGEFERIHQKWFGAVEGVRFTRFEVLAAVAAALALALGATGWGFLRQRAMAWQIADLNAALERRVAERTGELAVRVADVERLNRELEAFSYSASHDLRSPLRNIGGFVELLQRRTAGKLDSESDRFLGVIGAESRRLSRLIDELLAFARIGQAELRRERVDLAALVAEVRVELEPAAAGRRVEWRIDRLPVVHGDAALLRLAFANLLDNALKFSRGRDPAIVAISVDRRPGPPGHVTLEVRDNGAGFDPRFAAKLFGVFQRLHNQRQFEGTGIGLANVRRVVERHGGSVTAEGIPDGGAVFRLVLPEAE